MTGSNDLDRMLGTYLDEGPRRSPDRPVEAAIAHARAHPRRRDPLGFLRPDVMARRSSLVSPQLAWAALLVVLTLGAVAAIAIGSRPNTVPVVPPPTVIESPSPSAAPSEPPASASPRSFDIAVVDEHDIRHLIEVIDLSGTLVAADGGPVFNEALAGDTLASNDPDVPGGVFVAWTYASCASPTTVTIDASGSLVTIERPRCTGDALGGNPLHVSLRFDGEVDAEALDVQLVETP
jgi:hypothetical protein